MHLNLRRYIATKVAIRLTACTDFARRVRFQTALPPEKLLSIAQVAQDHAIFRGHVMKAVSALAQPDYLETIRRRSDTG